MGLAQGKFDQPWLALSGGERQRCAIGVALALACTVDGDGSVDDEIWGPPAVLLLDEPTAACDGVSCTAVERSIIASGIATVLITHDERQALRLAHKRLILT